MRRTLFTGLLLAASALLANAAEYLIDQEDDTRQQCAGIWSKKSWGGDVDPFIEVAFKARPETEKDQIVSLLIFEWEDGEFLGKLPSPESQERRYICDDDAIKSSLCNKTEIGQFIVADNTNTTSSGTIYTTAVNLKDPKPLKYSVVRTGYYCVQTFHFTAKQYEAVAVFQNPYGELPGSQIAKLPFYGGLTIVYAVVGVLWAFLYVQHRRDILPVQNYITAIIIFLIIEMLITWAFYDYTNNHGNTLGSKVLMIIVAILNAGRNSFSFFLLLIVCMGYGVVKPTLGKTMNLVRALAIGHFIFGVIYSVASLTLSPDSAGPIVLLVILPLSATLTAFYVWTLNSLNLTMKELQERKQNVKSLMYKRLWWVLLSSIIVIFGFFFINSLTFAGHGSPDFAPTHWKTRWFVLDGWLNLVYLVNLAIIAYIWRPTANNRRFAMSDELAQDDDGFEIASIGGSDEDDLERASFDNNRNRSGLREYAARPTSSGSPTVVMKGEQQQGRQAGGLGGSGAGGGPSTVRRDSGEAIFSVGGEGEGSSDEDDAWSDNEDKKKLTGGRKRD